MGDFAEGRAVMVGVKNLVSREKTFDIYDTMAEDGKFKSGRSTSFNAWAQVSFGFLSLAGR